MTTSTSAKVIDIQLHITLRELRVYLERIRNNIEQVKDMWIRLSESGQLKPGSKEEFEDMLTRLVNLKMIVIKRMDAIYGELDDDPKEDL